MKHTLVIFWAWGLVLTAYVCYERSQFHATHISNNPAPGLNHNLQTQTQDWTPRSKFSD